MERVLDEFKYKVWVEIEKISNAGEKDEDYETVSPLPTCIGVFDTQEAAQDFIDQFTRFSTLD